MGGAFHIGPAADKEPGHSGCSVLQRPAAHCQEEIAATKPLSGLNSELLQADGTQLALVQ